MRERPNKSALREALEEMTHDEDVSKHPALLATLTREHPNSVALLDSAHPIRRYTCLMQVFDFTEKDDYAAIATRGLGRIYASANFAHSLLQNNVLIEVTQSDAREGGICFISAMLADSSTPDECLRTAGLCLSGV